MQAALRVERGEHPVGHEVDRGLEVDGDAGRRAGARLEVACPLVTRERRDDGGDDGCGRRRGHGDHAGPGGAMVPALPADQPLEGHLVLVGRAGRGRDLVQGLADVGAGHESSSVRSSAGSASRSRRSAWWVWLLTAPSEQPSSRAVSATERSSK